MICWTRRLLAQMKNNKKLIIYTSYKTDATNISVTGLQQFGSVSGLVPYACDEISSLRMFRVCPDVRRLSGSSRFPHYWQGPLGNVWQVYLYRNAKGRRIWIKTFLTLRRTIRLSICNPVHKPRTLKNKIGKINTITYDNIFDKLHCFINEEISWV